jgi:hypothetical protein
MLDTQSRRKLETRFVDEPPPEREPRGGERDALFAVLAGMKVGGPAVDVNCSVKSLSMYVYRFRLARGREFRFIIRRKSPGHSRVWRVQ